MLRDIARKCQEWDAAHPAPGWVALVVHVLVWVWALFVGLVVFSGSVLVLVDAFLR